MSFLLDSITIKMYYLNSKIFSMSVLNDYSLNMFLFSPFFLFDLSGLWFANYSRDSYSPLHAILSFLISSSLISLTSFSASIKILDRTPGLMSFTWAVPSFNQNNFYIIYIIKLKSIEKLWIMCVYYFYHQEAYLFAWVIYGVLNRSDS